MPTCEHGLLIVYRSTIDASRQRECCRTDICVTRACYPPSAGALYLATSAPWRLSVRVDHVARHLYPCLHRSSFINEVDVWRSGGVTMAFCCTAMAYRHDVPPLYRTDYAAWPSSARILAVSRSSLLSTSMYVLLSVAAKAGCIPAWPPHMRCISPYVRSSPFARFDLSHIHKHYSHRLPATLADARMTERRA